MKRKTIKIVITILLFIIFLVGIFIYMNKAVIFQRGNPIPYITKALTLNEAEPYKKVFSNKEIYISKSKEKYPSTQDSLIKFIESKYEVSFIEQAGSSYIFKSDSKTVILSSEIYLKYYNVWEISTRANTELADLIPMVKIGGKLYLDTGKESDIKARCGVIDGKIISKVEPFEKPTQDNQSNFGIGYEYQFVGNDGIDIFINGKFIRFQLEETDYSAFIKLLDYNNFKYTEETPDNDQHLLSTIRRPILIENEIISVYEYNSNEDMEKEASYINKDGWGISYPGKDIQVEWSSKPHFFKKGTIIINYVGENKQILDFLIENYGTEFAGHENNNR